MAAAKRKQISKKTRFEVFKRDGFKCQYCGRQSPEVILHVDHMDPVAKGGDNNILNLITSCADCNGGKGATPLSEQSVLAKSRQQIAELNERAEQLKMMAQWRRAVMKMGDQEAALFVEELQHALGGITLAERAQNEARAILRKYGYVDAHKAFQAAIDRHGDWRNGELTNQSLGWIFRSVDRIASYAKLPPETQAAHYCRGILRNKFPDEVYAGGQEWRDCLDLLLRAAAFHNERELKELCKEAESYSQWWDEVQSMVAYMESIHA